MKNFEKASKNAQDTKRIKKILSEEVRLGINASDDSETEEVDLKKEIFPLGHYLNDREEMIEQMFSIIKGNKLKRMLPPILKGMPLDELKADCLIHLLGMSTKRIMAIFEGREINSSSDSETHSDSSMCPRKKSKKCFQPIIIKQEGCSDISDNSEEVVLIDPDQDVTTKGVATKKSKYSADEGLGKHTKKHKRRKKILLEKSQKASKSSHEISKTTDKVIQTKENSPDSSSGCEKDEASSPKEGKTLLEILELEMRARAIRALLTKGNNTETPSQSTESLISNKEKETQKVTPAKNFRSKKRKSKNDDVIVIAPKVVTIDLTDENNTNVRTTECGESSEEINNLIHSIEVNSANELEKPNSLNSTDSSEENSEPSETKSDNEEDKGDSNKTEKASKELGVMSESPEQSATNPKTVDDEVIAILDSPERNSAQGSSENSEKIEQPSSSWTQRWLESKEVKKVVTTSKIYGNIRKNIKKAKLAKQSKLEEPKLFTNTPDVQGSVDEYKSLPKSTIPVNSKSDITNLAQEVGVSSKLNEEISTQKCQEQDSGVDNIATQSVEQIENVTSTQNEMSYHSKLEEITDSNISANTSVPTTVSDQKLNVNETEISDGDIGQEIVQLAHSQHDKSEVVVTSFPVHEKFAETVSQLSNSLQLNEMFEFGVSDTSESTTKITPIETSASDILSINLVDNSRKETSSENGSNENTSRSEVVESSFEPLESTNSDDNLNESKITQTHVELEKPVTVNNISSSLPETTDRQSDITSKISKGNSVSNIVSSQNINIPNLDALELVKSTEVSSPQEPNELEALEININDEDRDIE